MVEQSIHDYHIYKDKYDEFVGYNGTTHKLNLFSSWYFARQDLIGGTIDCSDLFLDVIIMSSESSVSYRDMIVKKRQQNSRFKQTCHLLWQIRGRLADKYFTLWFDTQKIISRYREFSYFSKEHDNYFLLLDELLWRVCA